MTAPAEIFALSFVYGHCVLLADVRFIEGDAARIEGIWLVSERRGLGGVALEAAREAIDPVNALIGADPDCKFSFHDLATAPEAARSACGALARVVWLKQEELKRSSTTKSVPSHAPSQPPGHHGLVGGLGGGVGRNRSARPEGRDDSEGETNGHE
jgi:hypothetical protein